MRNKRLQSQVTAGRWTLPAVIFICALCWVLTYFLFPDSIASTTPKDSSSFLQSTRDLLLPGWAERIVSFLFYAIIGKSGSGKSTLLHILSGLDRPTAGNVLIDGKDLFSCSDEKMAIFRRRQMGFEISFIIKKCGKLLLQLIAWL